MFGDLIKNKRKKLRITQQELAIRASVSRANIAKIETNKYLPSILLCRRLFLVLGMNKFYTITMSILDGKIYGK